MCCHRIESTFSTRYCGVVDVAAKRYQMHNPLSPSSFDVCGPISEDNEIVNVFANSPHDTVEWLLSIYN